MTGALCLGALVGAPMSTEAANASCGWMASSWTQSGSYFCGSASDCYKILAYSDPARTVPVTIYSRPSGLLDWVDTTSDCVDRYTKENYYNCTINTWWINSCNWSSPLASNPQNGFEPSRCRLVTKGNCQNNIGS